MICVTDSISGIFNSLARKSACDAHVQLRGDGDAYVDSSIAPQANAGSLRRNPMIRSCTLLAFAQSTHFSKLNVRIYLAPLSKRAELKSLEKARSCARLPV